MVSLEDVVLMNDALINYYEKSNPKNEKRLLKHEIIRKVLKTENCFNKISKEDALKILKDIGVHESQTESVYYNIAK